MALRTLAIALGLILGTSLASADPGRSSRLTGRVVDDDSGKPVESVRVHVAGLDGFKATAATDRSGRYAIDLPPGVYTVMFAYGTSRSRGRVVLRPAKPATLNVRIDGTGEVIVIRERQPPAKLATAKNHSPTKTPPYSDRAIRSDAWTRAWLLLDIDERGRVTRFKFAKRPGFDLETIATKEAFRLRFEPARDRAGRPIRSQLFWKIEWPSYWWLIDFIGVASRMPPTVGFPPRPLDANVPCAGSGPLELGSIHPVYKDCSVPDFSGDFSREPWIVRSR